MNWYVGRCYGFGVSGVPLAARPYSAVNGTLASWQTVADELAGLESPPGWRRNAAVVSSVVVVLILLTIAAPHRERVPISGITIARFETAQSVPERPLEPPPIAIEPDPIAPVVEPVPIVEPVAVPKPAPVAKPKPVAKPERKPIAKPKPAPPVENVARAEPRPVLPSFPSAPKPAKAPPEPPIQQARPQPPTPTAPRIRAPRINPLRAPNAPAASTPAFEVARVARPAAPRSTARARINVMSLAAVAAPNASIPEAAVSPVRAQRREAHPTAGRVTRVASISPAKIALPAMAAKPTASLAKRTSIARIAPVPAPERTTGRGAPRERDRVAGVSLASLADCVSDREEDRLKRRVIAAAVGNKQCESRAGRFRFVETKNLNAFLMWTERAASRRQADRCVELELALNCLRTGNVAEARY